VRCSPCASGPMIMVSCQILIFVTQRGPALDCRFVIRARQSGTSRHQQQSDHSCSRLRTSVAAVIIRASIPGAWLKAGSSGGPMQETPVQCCFWGAIARAALWGFFTVTTGRVREHSLRTIPACREIADSCAYRLTRPSHRDSIRGTGHYGPDEQPAQVLDTPARA
jgi:hypothetical protein